MLIDAEIEDTQNRLVALERELNAVANHQRGHGVILMMVLATFMLALIGAFILIIL